MQSDTDKRAANSAVGWLVLQQRAISAALYANTLALRSIQCRA
jgi:hypothetical protein